MCMKTQLRIQSTGAKSQEGRKGRRGKKGADGMLTIKDIEIPDALALAQRIGVQQLLPDLQVGAQLALQHNVNAAG